MANKMIVAGKITKRNGSVVSTTILAQPIAGMSQRWGLAARDPRSGRHDKINYRHPKRG